MRVSTTVARGAYGSLAKLAARRGLGEFADLSGSGTRPSCRTFHNPDMVMHIQCTIQHKAIARNTLVSLQLPSAFML